MRPQVGQSTWPGEKPILTYLGDESEGEVRIEFLNFALVLYGTPLGPNSSSDHPKTSRKCYHLTQGCFTDYPIAIQCQLNAIFVVLLFINTALMTSFCLMVWQISWEGIGVFGLFFKVNFLDMSVQRSNRWKCVTTIVAYCVASMHLLVTRQWLRVMECFVTKITLIHQRRPVGVTWNNNMIKSMLSRRCIL